MHLEVTDSLFTCISSILPNWFVFPRKEEKIKVALCTALKHMVYDDNDISFQFWAGIGL